MFSKIKNIMSKRNKNQKHQGNAEDLKQFVLSANINDNITRLKEIMNQSFDIVTRDFKIANSNTRAAIIYIDNISNGNIIQEHILKPLIFQSTSTTNTIKIAIDLETIKDSMLTVGSIQEAETFDKIVLAILSGDVFLCVQGYTKGLIISAREYKGKNFSEPTMEPSVRGPKEALVEILATNIGLIRRRIRDPNLTFEVQLLGRRTKSEVVITYIKGVVNQNIVDEARKRITALDIDGEINTTEISHLIIEKPNSIFPLTQQTERIDRLVAALLNGRVAILMNGSPEAILIPVTLPMLMQSVDDYFENWLVASFIRFSRYIGLFVSSLFPALYIAITSFNPGMLPTTLILSIAGTRTGVPFPAVIEALIMEFVLELLQEAGIRLPKVVGQTVSIVGGLVIGQSAVQAGVVSPIMVIIIAITAVSSFTIPDYSLSLATRIIRVPFMFLAVIFGIFGITMGMLFLLTYLASLKSFGVPYLSPITPYRIRDWKDTFIRAPFWTMGKRPEFLSPEDTQKQKIKKSNLVICQEINFNKNKRKT